jgi:hypothetical protein
VADAVKDCGHWQCKMECPLWARSRHHGARGGPINGVRTGFARPKKTTAPLPPKRVDNAGGSLGFSRSERH